MYYLSFLEWTVWVSLLLNVQQRDVLTILFCTLIVPLLIISGNVHVHPGPVAFPITDSTANDLGLMIFVPAKT